jgi:thiaminase/transcriptional activator TenA
MERQTGRKIMDFFERPRTAASAAWRPCTAHAFTSALADGSLAEATFRDDLIENGLFRV